MTASRPRTTHPMPDSLPDLLVLVADVIHLLALVAWAWVVYTHRRECHDA